MSEYTIDLKSSILAGPTEVTVLVPSPKPGANAREFYGSGKKYKVLWLLHAGSGGRNDWLHYTSIARHAEGREAIVVMPNGLNSDFANHPEFADGYNFSDFFFDELMPFIHRWFPASDKPEDNFLAGFSMGAAGAWMYGLYRPESFGGICPVANPLKVYTHLEPYRSMTAAEFRARATSDRKSIPAGYGPPQVGIHIKEVNMVAKYPTVAAFLDSYEHTHDRFREAAKAGKLPKVYLPCATDDRNYLKVMQFKEYADRLGAKTITCDFVENGGGGFAFCDRILPRMMDFFGIQ